MLWVLACLAAGSYGRMGERDSMRDCCERNKLEDAWAAHREQTRRLLRSLSCDADLTEDLLQETYIRAMRGLRGYRGGDVRAWLGAIAKNVFLTHIRKRANSSECPAELESNAPLVADPGSAFSLQLADLRNALAALPRALRDALLLRHYGGYTCEAIAERAGCPASTIRWRVHRAIALVRQALEPTVTASSECASLRSTLLLDYLYGTLPPDEVARAETHLRECDECREEAGHLCALVRRLDELRSSRSVKEVLELDDEGGVTLYLSASMVNATEKPIGSAVFRFNKLSALSHLSVEGEPLAWEADGEERFEYGSQEIIRSRNVVRLPRRVSPGERLDLLVVARPGPERRAKRTENGSLRLRWVQFPTLFWADDHPEPGADYSQAIRLPAGSRLLRVHPLPEEIHCEGSTTLVWHASLSESGPFSCMVEYRP